MKRAACSFSPIPARPSANSSATGGQVARFTRSAPTMAVQASFTSSEMYSLSWGVNDSRAKAAVRTACQEAGPNSPRASSKVAFRTSRLKWLRSGRARTIAM